jgi:hypothetical protein
MRLLREQSTLPNFYCVFSETLSTVLEGNTVDDFGGDDRKK